MDKDFLRSGRGAQCHRHSAALDLDAYQTRNLDHVVAGLFGGDPLGPVVPPADAERSGRGPARGPWRWSTEPGGGRARDAARLFLQIGGARNRCWPGRAPRRPPPAARGSPGARRCSRFVRARPCCSCRRRRALRGARRSSGPPMSPAAPPA
ncbi:MAG: hypothetical protein H6741_12485 [Alphaproteobacteria bacterium]|nr:hypothetical protein [Alphaproteobacteria bacterium]